MGTIVKQIRFSFTMTSPGFTHFLFNAAKTKMLLLQHQIKQTYIHVFKIINKAKKLQKYLRKSTCNSSNYLLFTDFLASVFTFFKTISRHLASYYPRGITRITYILLDSIIYLKIVAVNQRNLEK